MQPEENGITVFLEDGSVCFLEHTGEEGKVIIHPRVQTIDMDKMERTGICLRTTH